MWANFSPQRNLRLPEKAQCFVQILTFKSHPWCSNSNAICQQWLAKHYQTRKTLKNKYLARSFGLYSSRLRSTQPLPLLDFTWLVTQPYMRNWTQPYTRNLTRLHTRNQLSHTRELNSAIHASAIHATRQCFGHSFDEHMFAVCYNYNMSRWSWVHACSALGSCRSCARRCHASVTGVYLALGNVLRLVVS